MKSDNSNIDFELNVLSNLVLQKSDSIDSLLTTEGQIGFDSTSGVKKNKYFDGTVVQTIASEAYVDSASTNISWDSQTDNYTLVITDAGKLIKMDKSTSVSVTVPNDSSVNFDIGAQVMITQENNGQVTMVADTGVIIHSADALVSTRVRYSTINLIKKSTNTWLLIGDLA